MKKNPLKAGFFLQFGVPTNETDDKYLAHLVKNEAADKFKLATII
jgi:hypothetical protein